MKRFLKKISTVFKIGIVLFAIIIVAGCDNGSSESYKVTFVYDNGSSDVITTHISCLT